MWNAFLWGNQSGQLSTRVNILRNDQKFTPIYIYKYIEPTTLIWHPNQTKSKFLSLLPHTLFTFATFFPPFSAVIVGAALLFA